MDLIVPESSRLTLMRCWAVRGTHLLCTYAGHARLIEVKSSAGSPSERLYSDLLRHLREWPSLPEATTVEGGALILNHEHNKNPLDRSLEPYIRAEFVASETGLILALRSLALVDLLLEPSLDCLSAVSHVTAHPIADWAVAVVSPAVQGMNGDAQHFRDIRERHQLVTGLEGHDHLPFRGSQSGSVLGLPSERGDLGAATAACGQAARPDRSTGRVLATVKNLSRETTVGGRRATTRIELA
jgi:hypothetical protein